MEISWTFQFHRRHLLPRQQMPYLMEAIIIFCHGMISNPAVVSIAIGKTLPSGWDHVTFSLGCVKDLWVRGGIFLPAKFCDLENPLLLFKKDLASMLFTSWQWSGGFGNKNILMIRTILDSFLKKNLYLFMLLPRHRFARGCCDKRISIKLICDKKRQQRSKSVM